MDYKLLGTIRSSNHNKLDLALKFISVKSSQNSITNENLSSDLMSHNCSNITKTTTTVICREEVISMSQYSRWTPNSRIKLFCPPKILRIVVVMTYRT